MIPFLLLGGAAAGAAGLTAAALMDSRRSGTAQVSFDSLDAAGVIRHLDAYFWKSSRLLQQVSDILMQSIDLCAAPVCLPDDNLAARAGDLIGCGLTAVQRRLAASRLKDARDDAWKLYMSHRGLFARGNDLLREADLPMVTHARCRLKELSFDMDHSLNNDDWSLCGAADPLQDFLTGSGDAANRLIESLEKLQDAPKSGADRA